MVRLNSLVVAMVRRNTSGSVIGAMANKFKQGSSLLGEALVARLAIQLAIDLNKKHLIIEGNAKIVIQYLQITGVDFPWENSNILFNCENLLHKVEVWSLY